MADAIVYRQRRRGKDGNIRLVSEIIRRVPTQDELKAILWYDPETGLFTHLRTIGKGFCGTVAGRINRYGYHELRVMNRLFVAHRLAFLYMTGSFPEPPLTVDHINGIRNDNRWSNLRVATRIQQSWNCAVSRSNQSGLKGAWPCKSTGRWQSMLHQPDQVIWLGRFDTAEEAHAAWVKAAIKHRGAEWVRETLKGAA